MNPAGTMTQYASLPYHLCLAKLKIQQTTSHMQDVAVVTCSGSSDKMSLILCLYPSRTQIFQELYS